MKYILRTRNGNYLCLRDYCGEPQYFLSTGEGRAVRFDSLKHATAGATLGVEALRLKLTFNVVGVEQ